YPPSLAVVMGLIQVSHFKLWLAGNLRNWPLAEYQLSQMNAALQDARALFPNVPEADTSAMSAEELRDAIRIKDGTKFDAAFKKFTSECNSCHERVGLRFIKIGARAPPPILPPPRSNGSFAPDGAPSPPPRRCPFPPSPRPHPPKPPGPPGGFPTPGRARPPPMGSAPAGNG